MINPLYLSDAFGQYRIQEDYLASTKKSLRQRGERGITTVGGSSALRDSLEMEVVGLEN